MKKVDRVLRIFELADSDSRAQWEYVNQKGFDFSNDNQLSEEERVTLEEQGMPTFTINRIMPVVEMLNFYATAKGPRWQAVGVDGSDTDVASVFSDVADYIWDLSDGSTIFANCVNDCVTKSIGYLMVTIDKDSDQGMGDVVIKQPEPFDIFVDPKSRDILFRDAAFIMCRKILPKEHLKKLYPEQVRKINAASSNYDDENNLSEKSTGDYKKDFSYKDIDSSESVDPNTGEHDELLEYFELYEKVKVPFVNVFMRAPINPEVMTEMKKAINKQIESLKEELSVKFLETKQQLDMALQQQQILPERYELELKKAQEEMEVQIESTRTELEGKMMAEATKVDNVVVPEEDFKIMQQEESFNKMLVDAVKFYKEQIKLTCVAGDKLLYEKEFPEGITDYPIIPFHYKWTGTPFPISAVSPLIGKQREINKAHQILVHNASLGSSLRWMHEEGSIDADYWEKYSSSPGALLPIRPGAQAPTAVQPAPLSSAFYDLIQMGKNDMEYLAGIYSSMMGDTGKQHETYRGMLAMDEYGTRRIKQWMQNSIEPALKHTGEIVKQFTQAVYSSHKVFRMVQPNAMQGEKETEINIPLYNDLGEAIGKLNDYQAAKFDVRVIAGSTLPVNRWAYLSELKELLQMGVVDDIAVLSETDIKNKETIAKRKSMYAQMQSQLSSMEESLKDKDGTIETLQRQLVQAGIKGKVQDAEMEITKQKEQFKANLKKSYLQTEAEQKLATRIIKEGATKANKALQDKTNLEGEKISMEANNIIKNLQNQGEDS
tara:strand:+ start:7539 stop:9860 length:2322 start_codon:yes stop_codon:yes gene_type:complete